MKYTKKEIIIKTVVSEEVSDYDDIRSLMRSCHENRYDLSFRYQYASIGSLSDPVLVHYKRVRVTKVNENSIDIMAFKGDTIFNARDIPFSAIDSISFVSNIDDIFKKKDKIGDWDFLDIT